MKIKWSEKALEMVENTLDYWDNRNKSTRYSQKITEELEIALIELADDPYFLTNFYTDIRLYRKAFFDRKFYLYYEIIDEEDVIYIKHFKSAYQKLLSKFI